MSIVEQDSDTFVARSTAEGTTSSAKSRGELIQQILVAPTSKQNAQSTLEESPARGESSNLHHVEPITFQLPEFASRPRSRHRPFVAAQEWEGHVVDVSDQTFTARLMDVTAGVELDREEADFLISDLDESDHDLLVPGAVFRWSIGYLRNGTTKIRGSQIVFRRLPKWQAIDVDQGKNRAEELAAAIVWK